VGSPPALLIFRKNIPPGCAPAQPAGAGGIVPANKR
jgi:hypothetical protein